MALAAVGLFLLLASSSYTFRVGAILACERSGGAYLKEAKVCVNLTDAGYCAMDEEQTRFKYVPLEFDWDMNLSGIAP